MPGNLWLCFKQTVHTAGGQARPAGHPLGVDERAIGKDCQPGYHAGHNGRVIMPTRSINLTDDHDAFVEKMVKAGKYQNASEAMRDAVRGLQQR